MGKFGAHFGGNYDTYDEEIEFTVGKNTIIRFSKEGKIQIKSKKGIISFQQKGGSPFTTSSTSFVDITGISTKYLPTSLSTKQNQSKLKRIYQRIKKNKVLLKKLTDKSPLELEFLDVNIGIIKIRFKPKKRKLKYREN